MSSLELVLRAVGIVQLALLASVMLYARRRDHTARIGAALGLSVATFMLTSMPDAEQLLGVFIHPLTAICSTHPVWFWLFCAALFSDGFKIGRGHIACIVAMAILGVVYQGLLQPQWHSAPPGVVRTFGIAFGLASLAFISLGPITIFAGKRSDLDERRRRIRSWFVPAASAYLGIVVLVQAWAVIAGRNTPEPLVVLNLAVIDVLAALALVTFFRIRVVNWLDLVDDSVPGADSLSSLERGVLDRLTRRFVSEQLYAREGLTITALAELLGTQEHVLRRVINRALGFRNYNDFLHSHRLRDASARLRDPAGRRVPVLTIALEVGYGSIGPFNRAFKSRFGMTPTEYRRTGKPAPLSESA
jgi:AraC-like DNA-binding protein